MEPLTPKQIQWARHQVARWFYVRHEWEQRPVPTTFAQLAADADHSALLYRLLSGKEPLPEPPPLHMGYPDYSYGETKLDVDAAYDELEEEYGTWVSRKELLELRALAQSEAVRIAQLEEALRPLVYGKTTYLYEGAGMNEPDFVCVYCEYSVGDGHSLDCPIPKGRAALSSEAKEAEGE